jgi:uncharacterized DUF497 family protein
LKINEIIWLEDIVEKLEYKHNIRQYEVVEVLNNHPKFKFVEKGYKRNEDIYAALGQSLSGRYLIVFFICKENNKIIVVSARDMTKNERKLYEKK